MTNIFIHDKSKRVNRNSRKGLQRVTDSRQKKGTAFHFSFPKSTCLMLEEVTEHRGN